MEGRVAITSLQSCLTLCDPIDGSPPGSPIPGILRARTLEWVAISFSNAWKWKVESESEAAQSCPILNDPMDFSLPGSSVHGIFQARGLEWGAIAFSRREEYMNSIHFMNTSKIHLPVEQFSLNNNWKLAERFLYNEVYRKCPHKIRSARKRSQQVRTCAPGRGLRKWGRLWGRRLAFRNEQLESHIRHHSPKDSHREYKHPMTGWRATGANRKAVGSLDSALRSTLTVAGSKNKLERVNWKPLQQLPIFLWPLQCVTP